jgi:hypothetical protein
VVKGSDSKSDAVSARRFESYWRRLVFSSNLLSVAYAADGRSEADDIKQRIGGSVVEFSPATREARVRFPADATAPSHIFRVF